MEERQRPLVQASPMSRYIHLSWALFERAEGQVKNARGLLQRGNMYNPKDAAILQVCPATPSPERHIDQPYLAADIHMCRGR